MKDKVTLHAAEPGADGGNAVDTSTESNRQFKVKGSCRGKLKKKKNVKKGNRSVKW